ncbi:MAG: hypothetical protein H7240_09140 [Glaciimonas sp.]|nr:hypothetical protein [Glaciimonas sp.]
MVILLATFLPKQCLGAATLAAHYFNTNQGWFCCSPTGPLNVGRWSHTECWRDRVVSALRQHEGYEHYTRLLQFQVMDAVLEVSYKVPNIQWRVVYAVSVWSVLWDRVVSISVGVLLFVFLTFNMFFDARRIARIVISPAALQPKRLADRAHFNRTVVETLPLNSI